MPRKSGVNVKKPVNIWRKPLSIDFKTLFISLSKSALQGAICNWTEATSNALDALSSLGLSDSSEDKAWKLIYKALVKSTFDIVKDNKELLHKQAIESELLYKELDLILSNSELVIDSSFFKAPFGLAIFKDIKGIFAKWLKNFDLIDAQVQSICNRLDSYFVFALNSEWQKNYEEYKELFEILDTPFTGALKKESAWFNYSTWLQKQIDEPLFLEAFSLKQIFVNLNAYYRKRKENEENTENLTNNEYSYDKVVVDIGKELELWVGQGDPEDSIRVICGGPGSGKSSLAKVFAAQQAQIGKVNVLFIPLHHFGMDSDLVSSVGRFIKYDGFIDYNPLTSAEENKRLLIIFDGLDEFEIQGKVGSEVAQTFVREVKEELYQQNKRNLRLQVIITSRDVAIQSNQNEFKKEKQILYLLEYFIPMQIKHRRNRAIRKELDVVSFYSREDFIDPKKLLKDDKRQLWWNKYGKANGKNYTKMPKELNHEKLYEITSQPLLNYLVALSYDRKEIDFNKESNLNIVYEDLLKSVYNRDWEDSKHKCIEHITYQKFVRILEEIALATWHGNGRTTTTKEIRKYCEDSNLADIINSFQDGDTGVTRLLMAFYFRQSTTKDDGNKTFEFTHKTFGEYLVAKRIIRGIQVISNNLKKRREDSDYGWSEKESLKVWINICGRSAINEYIYNFIKNEVQLMDINCINDLQDCCCELISYVLKYNMPFEFFAVRPVFQEELRQARNAGEALIIMLCSFSSTTKRLTTLNYSKDTALGEWFNLLQGQRTDGGNPIFMTNINHINFNKAVLHGHDFYGIQVYDSIMTNISAAFTNFSDAQFINVNFKSAWLNSAKFSSISMIDVNLDKAELTNANFRRARLNKVSIREAQLDRVDLRESHLTSVCFRNSRMNGVLLDYAVLEDVSFEGVKIDKFKPFIVIINNVEILVDNLEMLRKINEYTPKNISEEVAITKAD